MWYPEKLILKNFMSHENSEFIFVNGVATMLYGKNESDEGSISNGSGKSAILEGLSVALINSSLRKVSTKELVTDGEIESSQTFILNNSILNKKLEIQRTIFSNSKSGKVNILINGEAPEVDLTNVDDANKFIINEIGIEREDLLNYFLISKEKYEPFLNISDTKKKNIIARFSQANLIDPSFEKIDNSIDKKTNQLEKVSQDQDILVGKIEVYENEITNFSMKSLEDARDRKINELRAQIEENDKEIILKKENNSNILIEVENLEIKLTNLESIDYQKEIKIIENSIKDIRNENDIEKKEWNGLIELEAKVRKGLSDEVKCPKCSHAFSISNAKLNIEKAKFRHQQIKDAIKESEKFQEEGKEKIISLQKEILSFENEENDFRRDKNQINQEIDSFLNKKSRGDLFIERLLSDNITIKSSIAQIKNKQLEDKRSEFKDQIKELNNQIIDLVKKAEGLITEKSNKVLLKETFTKFKTFLSNKAIGAIEANANDYLEKTKTNLSIQLDGYKMTRTKKLRENITATILRDGLAAGSYSRLSSGEKARVEIAVIMSLQKLINSSCDFGKGLNLTWLDEVIESVDSSGIGGIMKSLNSVKQTIVVITHGTFDQVYPHIVSVVKKEGISNIYYGE